MQPLEVTTLWAMRMIERRDTSHKMQFWVVHGSDSKSLYDEGFLPKSTVAVDPSPTTIPVVAAAAFSHSSTIAALPTSAPSALEVRLIHLEEG